MNLKREEKVIVVVCVLIVSIFCVAGYGLTMMGYETVGNETNNVGMLIAVGLPLLGLLGIILGFTQDDNGPSTKSIFFLIMAMSFCLSVNYPLKKEIDWVFVQHVENPKMVAEIASIEADLKKVQSLRDFMDGKEVLREDCWFSGDTDLAEEVAVYRILGVSWPEAEKIFPILDVTQIIEYRRARPDWLEIVKGKTEGQLAEAN